LPYRSLVEAGYSWFGNQSPQFGGFPLPAYLNWQFGVTFTRKVFNLDLRLLRHQSLAGKLFRPDRRSECAAGRRHQPDHQP
jgi:hypothetical protein